MRFFKRIEKSEQQFGTMFAKGQIEKTKPKKKREARGRLGQDSKKKKGKRGGKALLNEKC